MKAVYLIKEGSNNYYKIGVSKDVNSRIKQLQTGSAGSIEFYYEFYSEYSYKIEKALHRHHKFNNISGEWFDLTREQVDGFLDTCQKYENNIKATDKTKNPHYNEYKRRV